MADYFAYIIQSEVDGTFYKGFTTDIIARLKRHNEGRSRYTSRKIPWKLVYLEKCESKTAGLVRENQLKKYNPKYILWLIKQPINIAKYYQ